MALEKWRNGQSFRSCHSALKKQFPYILKKTRKLGAKRNPRTNPRMTFQGKAIKMATSARYLGFMIDNELNGMAHCAYFKESLADYVRVTHSLSRRNGGLSGDVHK